MGFLTGVAGRETTRTTLLLLQAQDFSKAAAGVMALGDRSLAFSKSRGKGEAAIPFPPTRAPSLASGHRVLLPQRRPVRVLQRTGPHKPGWLGS